MPLPVCHRCRLPNVTPAPSGLCETCHSLAGDTSPLPDGVVTFTYAADAEATPVPGPGTLAALLPAGGLIYQEELGGGGMGVVYKAVRDATRQTVAVKRLRPNCYTASGLRRFVAEARSLAAVDHPQVVRLYEFNTDPRDPHLVMEYVEGRSLHKHLKGGPLPPRRAAELIAAAARGVQAAHAAGVIHRDLKPANLLVTPDWRVKVADFGLGKRLRDPDFIATDAPALPAAEGITLAGCLAGSTPGYMAPEQVDGSRAAGGEAIDVWGIGACLYAALTGVSPFPCGPSHPSAVLTDPLVPPRERVPAVPRELDAIARRCLEKDPAKRYPSAAAVADDLDRYLRGDSTAALPQGWPRRAWTRLRRTPRAVAVAWAAAVAVIFTAATALALVPRPTDRPPAMPVDEHAVMCEQFLRGEGVVVVPEKGLPKWHQWVVGNAQVTDSPTRDGSAYIRPFGTGAVKLFDPPADSYRVSVELLHRSPQDEEDEQGTWAALMLFHRRAERPNGPWADSFVTVRYRDWDPGPLKGRALAPQPVNVRLQHEYTERPGGRSCSGGRWLGKGGFKFGTGFCPPGHWRRIVAEVTPARLRVSWGDADAGDGGLTLVAEYSAAQLNRAYAAEHAMMKVIAANPPPPAAGAVVVDPALLPTEWPITGGLGLYATRSGLAFRNMTVRPVPTTP